MDIVNDIITQYGYVLVFISLALGVIGIPLPDEVLLLGIGYFTKFGSLHYIPALVICFSGAFLGMLLSYFLGSKSGQPIFKKLSKWFRVKEKTITRIQNFMDKYGRFSILLGCFIPGFRHIVGYFCGTANMKLNIYIFYMGTGAFTWCLLLLTLGRMMGHIN